MVVSDLVGSATNSHKLKNMNNTTTKVNSSRLILPTISSWIFICICWTLRCPASGRHHVIQKNHPTPLKLFPNIGCIRPNLHKNGPSVWSFFGLLWMPYQATIITQMTLLDSPLACASRASRAITTLIIHDTRRLCTPTHHIIVTYTRLTYISSETRCYLRYTTGHSWRIPNKGLQPETTNKRDINDACVVGLGDKVA